MADPPVTDPHVIDPRAFNQLDAVGTIRALGPWWALLVDGLDAAPVLELAGRQTAVLARHVGSGAGEDGALQAIDRLAEELSARMQSTDPPSRDDIDDVLTTSLTLLRGAGRALAAAGAFARATGSVAGLFVSRGGVPKHPVAEAMAGERGLAGDGQAARRHHGRPWQALCLWSAEVVERLQAEGHPIVAGGAGENVSVRGIEWAAVRPGTRLTLGSDVVAEVSVPALPCAKNARWFLGGDIMRMHHQREPGVSRMYATVLHGGTVRVGDAVRLEP